MEGVDLFEIFRGGEADFRGPGHDPQLFSIFAYALRGICVQPSFDQTDSVRLRFTESGDAFHVRQEAQHFDRAVIRLDLLYCLCALNAKHHFMKIVVNTVSPVLYRPNHMVINVVYASA